MFDVIVASDMVCCDGDAEGVARCVAKYMRPDGMTVFVVPTEYHRYSLKNAFKSSNCKPFVYRYGVKALIPRLREEGLLVFMRYLSHSACTPIPHSSDPTGGELSRIRPCECQSDYHRQVLGSLQTPENNDMLTHSLPETEFYQWILVIALHK